MPKLDLPVHRGADFKDFARDSDHCRQSRSHRYTERKRQTIIEAILTYVKGQSNESVEHRNFLQSSQQQRETFDDFLVSL